MNIKNVLMLAVVAIVYLLVVTGLTIVIGPVPGSLTQIVMTTIFGFGGFVIGYYTTYNFPIFRD